jgi:hypothetical protein
MNDDSLKTINNKKIGAIWFFITKVLYLCGKL